MKLLAAGLALAIAGTVAVHPFLGSGNDFDSVVSAVETSYHQQPQHIPMMWLASFAAGLSTHGGVRNMKIAEFDHFSGPASGEELDRLIGSRLHQGWKRMIFERSQNGALSVIYVHPDGQSMRMLIANYDGGELDIVRMDLNGERLAHFLDNPHDSPYHHSTEPD